MNNILKLQIIMPVVLLLSACASQTKKTNLDAGAGQLQPVEHAQTLALAQVTETCPAGEAWQSEKWKTIVKLVNGCVKAKDWKKVEKMGNFIATRVPTVPWGLYYLGLSADARQDRPRAIWMLELALKKSPTEGLFHYELGRIYWEMKEDADALQHLKVAVDYNPTLLDAQFILGKMAMQRQETSLAESYWQKTLAVDAKYFPALLGMAQLKIMQKNYADSALWLGRALQVNPQSSKVRLSLAQIQEENLRNLPDALESYQQLKKLASEKKLDEVVHVNLDDKIQSIQKTLSQTDKSSKLSVRTPSAEKQVQK